MIHDSFGPPGSHVPPSALVRRWDFALLLFILGAFVAGLGAALLMVLLGFPVLLPLSDLWHLPGSLDRMSELHEWIPALGITVPSLGFGFLGFFFGIKPMKQRFHIVGTQLLKDEAAEKEAHRRSVEDEHFALCIHPAWRMPKRKWSQHVMVFGGVGSGKSVLMTSWLDQAVQRHLPCMVYDVKGDLTARYKRGTIVSPYDTRSRRWDVARDITSDHEADILAEHLCPAPSGKFFETSAQMVIAGLVRMLHHTQRGKWTWTTLEEVMMTSIEEKKAILGNHYPLASQVLAGPDSKSSKDIEATLASSSRVVADLAEAWRDADKTWSIRKWIQGRHRSLVLLQGSGPAQLTSRYVGAIVNLAASHICSPKLDDGETSRWLGFWFDELADLTRGGVIDTRLWSLGRSKGVVVCAATQAPEQLEKNLGKEEAQALMSLAGTTVYCRMGAGMTRDQLAEHAGFHRVAQVHDGHASESHDRILTATDLTNGLGFDAATKSIRAIVDQGGDLLRLAWPLPEHRQARCAIKQKRRPRDFTIVDELS